MNSPHIGFLAALITFSVIPVTPAEAMPNQADEMIQATVTTDMLPTVIMENTTFVTTAPTVTTARQALTPVVNDGRKEARSRASSSQDVQATINRYRTITTGRAQAIYQAQ
ncbi:hypothetical protein [Acaryochloris sp. CCMEE 5410]|uniref:hypothetical protein n=1 Tax=Acaryochloris sp. CCMEE 5410 TaxID=310037 RepID=UPI0002483AA5|nr:hypothetical protein [Acaryochloris sp. CCMEE 5410]KAI9130886.1 hypothetical protein ON05_024535 [Acaryochloris sp. CCMEE 5410]